MKPGDPGGMRRPDGSPAWAEKGSARAITHGMRAKLALAPRAAELAAEIREVVPAYTDADQPLVELCGMVAAQVEAGNRYIAEHGWIDGKGNPRPLMKTLPTLQAELRRCLESLGCSPPTRARLGLTHVRGQALADHLDLAYSDPKRMDPASKRIESKVRNAAKRRGTT
jgi:hypothetical protein